GFARSDADIDPQRLLGLCSWELGVEPLNEGGWPAVMATLEARQPLVDLRLRSANGRGETIVVSNTALPVFDHAGRFTGYRGITRDITQAHLAEEQLRESEARFRSLTQLSSDWY